MGEWSYIPFADAVTVNPKVSMTRGKVYPFVDMKAIDPGSRSVSESEQREFKSGGARFLPEDTLMARITPCLENGKIARYVPHQVEPGPAFGSTEFIVVRGREGVTDNDYAYYLTKWRVFRDFAVSQMTGSSGRQRVPVGALSGLGVPVPPLPEQKAIAHILGTLDDKIELNRRMNETLEGIARAIFKSWFIDFDPVRTKAEGRDTGLPKEIEDLFPDGFEPACRDLSAVSAQAGGHGAGRDSELGDIPKGWAVGKIGNVVKCVGGSTPSTKQPKYWDGGTTPFVTPRDMSSLASPVVLDAERHITKDGVNTISSRMLPTGTVLISSRAPVGYLAITQRPVCVNQGIIAMICEGPLPAEYVVRWCEEHMDEIKGNASGTTFAEISKRNFRPLKVIVPDKGCACLFASIAGFLRQMIVRNMRETAALVGCRDALLPQLLSGRLSTPEFKQNGACP